MAADMVVGVAGTAMATVGMQEAVIRAALGGMALVRGGITLALDGMGVVVIGTAAGIVGGGWHHGGHGGGWGVGPAIGLGVGLGLLWGALAAGPYYSSYDYGYDYAPYAGCAWAYGLVLVRYLSGVLPCRTPMPSSLARSCSITA